MPRSATRSFSTFLRWLVGILALAVIAAACGTAPATVEDSAASDSTAPAEESVATTAPVQESDQTEFAETEAEADDALAGASEGENLAALTDEIESILVDWRERGGIPAVSLSVRLPGRDPINLASGVTDLTTDTPVTTEDHFRIGSVTKPMTAALVLQLVEEGLIELDEPVQTYLPTWLAGHPFENEITIRQLMNHTNGLVEYALSPAFYIESGTRLDRAFEPEEITEWLAVQDPLFAPGEQYSYETGGFLSLGSVIEAVTGNSAAAEMRTRIFEPAGAQNIYLTPEEFPPTPVVNGYGRAELYAAGTLLLGQEDQLGLMINGEPVVDFMTLPQEASASAGWTGGGNEAQLESVSAIMKALFDGTILSQEQIDLMTSPTLDVSYGLGIDSSEVDGVRVISHGGGVPGFRSHGAYLPDHDVSWALSANLIPLPEGSTLNDLIAELLPLFVEVAG